MSEINTDPNSYYTTVPSTLVTYAEKQLTDYVNISNVNVNNLDLPCNIGKKQLILMKVVMTSQQEMFLTMFGYIFTYVLSRT
jgi:hypothetical protein